MSSLAAWKLRGPVRTLRSEHAEWDVGRAGWGPPRHVSLVTFRRDGQVADLAHHNPNGSVSRRAWLHDDDGRVLEVRAWMDDGPPTRSVHTYDAMGRPALVEQIAPDGTRRELERSSYDGAGRRTKVTFLAPVPPAIPLVSIHHLEGTEWGYGVPGAKMLSVRYDERGLPAESSARDATGRLIRRIVFTRDQHGRPLTEVACFGENGPFADLPPDGQTPDEGASIARVIQATFEGSVFSRATYAYDTQGRLIERTMSVGTLSEERTTYEYGERDDPIAEVSIDLSRQVNIGDDGVVHATEQERHVRHIRYEYRYDTHDNWTERIVSGGGESPTDTTRSNADRRAITYF